MGPLCARRTPENAGIEYPEHGADGDGEEAV